jgi:hypothetical protein
LNIKDKGKVLIPQSDGEKNNNFSSERNRYRNVSPSVQVVLLQDAANKCKADK